MSTAYDKVAVVVPARNEATWISDCLRALCTAAEQVPAGVHVLIIVVADACDDDTAAVAQTIFDEEASSGSYADMVR